MIEWSFSTHDNKEIDFSMGIKFSLHSICCGINHLIISRQLATKKHTLTDFKLKAFTKAKKSSNTNNIINAFEARCISNNFQLSSHKCQFSLATGLRMTRNLKKQWYIEADRTTLLDPAGYDLLKKL